MPTIYKIMSNADWNRATAEGVYRGAPVDHADGFIHFSAADQVRETAAKYFAGLVGLCLVGVAAEPLGAALKWEPARGGALFPHLYGDLPLAAVTSVEPLEVDVEGRHVFPDAIP